MRRSLGCLGVAALLCAPHATGEELCRNWSAGESVGVLDPAFVPEASGLAVSRADPSRLYHVNDSGGGSFLYVSALDGSGLRRLRLDGVQALFDPEALTTGDLGGQPAVIVGDIGDNTLARPSVRFVAVREAEIQGDEAHVAASLSARYPDGPHNAEAMALGPDGALYVFTKSWTNRRQEPAPSRIYRLAREAWASPTLAVLDLEYVCELDLPALAAREKALFSDVVTDAALSADGSRILLLTYGYAWQFALDLSAGKIPPVAAMQRGRDYEVIRLKPLLGKETITYLPGDRSFLFGKEYKPDRRPSELIRMDCLD